MDFCLMSVYLASLCHGNVFYGLTDARLRNQWGDGPTQTINTHFVLSGHTGYINAGCRCEKKWRFPRKQEKKKETETYT